MCLGSASSSTSASSSHTSNQDNRVAADNGASVITAKGGASATTATASNANTVFSAAPDATVNYQDLTPSALQAVLGFASNAGQGAANFAAQTQASFQAAAASANKQDTTKIVQEVLLLAGAVAIAYFYFHK